ncbi:filamentous hemagglutinin family protein [Geobacter pelophilus]|uniref:Filamentous hemagglutinin family protein n=1 Tax=Geoanaerobacter pelophilus TaxID=60036 RepID=A0AAW4L583_9BACT|nr:filamentous haemagglutinin family protein [Geoanaerobacter pelophilus]MBT0666138.1 filamentous hemagglutinin family protein [Geoanaerobacter pelophilus]
MLRKTIALILIIDSIAMPVLGASTPRIPGVYRATANAPILTPPASSTLPSLKNILQGATVDSEANNQLTIRQLGEKAIIEWNSFDIGSGATVVFDQKLNGVAQKNWAALNRIYDRNPSQIFGSLKADGKVYLINQNGILFGEGAQVNVSSLIASSLNLKDADFLSGGTFKFNLDNYQFPDQPLTAGAVSNHGTISSGDLGSVFLMGPQVENSGSISSPVGQIGLVAGDSVDLSPDKSGKRQVLVQVLNNPGEAVNYGSMLSDAGVIGMYGKSLSQDGLVRAVTAIKKNGVIELQATDKILLGAGSRTESPVSDSDETAHQSFEFKGGNIQLTGLIPVAATVPDGEKIPVSRIELYGAIAAPSGSVTLSADKRVYLDKNSMIGVSGVWLSKPAEANLVEATFTSDNLRDEMIQKAGILKGKKIKFDAHLGSGIGDLSGYLTGREMSAEERAVRGGSISLTARSGEVVARNGSAILFAGGGVDYQGGVYGTTVLYSGSKGYDIANAPHELIYDRVGERTSYHPAHKEGSDAGSLSIIARQAALEGSLDGSVTRGLYQTKSAELLNSVTSTQSSRGVKEPSAGVLTIGSPPSDQIASSEDALLGSVVVKEHIVPLPSDFGAESILYSPYASFSDTTTFLDSGILNAAKLGTLSIHSNSGFTTEAGSSIDLAPAGSLKVTARSIDHAGAITVPAGKVSLVAQDNITSYPELDNKPNGRYEGMTSGIVLQRGSLVSVAGERVDKSPGTRSPADLARVAHTTGGELTVTDRTVDGSGVKVEAASTLDVSGGFLINDAGAVTGAKAGTLTIGGSVLTLDGNLKGHSLLGSNGGKIILNAGEIVVTPDPSKYEGDRGSKLILDDDRLAGTGFSQLELNSEHDLTIAAGVSLAPSRTKLEMPVPGRAVNVGLWETTDDLLGSSSVKLGAGVLLSRNDKTKDPNVDDSKLTIAAGAGVTVAPGGEIAVTAPEIAMAGTLKALAGKVSLTARLRELAMRSGARILASGYNRPDTKPIITGNPLGYTPLNGGSVKLDGYSLTLESGALIDVSGSTPVTGYMKNSQGRILSYTLAGAPGEVSLGFYESAVRDADFLATKTQSILSGGTFSMASRSLMNGFSLTGDELGRLTANGFDAFTFTSPHSISFSGDLDFTAGRSLVLNAPEIIGSTGAKVSLQSPWVRLINGKTAADHDAVAGTGTFAIKADWLDAEGDVRLSGFSDVSANIKYDLRLFDSYNLLPDGASREWGGALATSGNLLLSAARIYPGMHLSDPLNQNSGLVPSDFTISAGGDIKVLPSGYQVGGSIFSAGGSLTLNAVGNIEQRGYLAAPNGSITLKNRSDSAAGRIYLADGSVTTTAGEADVAFGEVNSLFWQIVNKKDSKQKSVEITAAPDKAVTLSADEVVVREGAQLDVSGGGNLYGYLFQKGLEGSNDPLKKSGRFVIMPDNSVKLPGSAVYLSGSKFFGEGVYSVLPEQYAFLPGAVMVTALGTTVASGEIGKTKEGYDVIAGYSTYQGTAVSSPKLSGYEVRRAEDVLKEGNFTVASLRTGDAGTITLKGSSTIVDGTLKATPVDGFRGGVLSMSGINVSVQSTRVPLPEGFDFSADLPQEMQGHLYVTAESLDKGFREITLGDIGITEQLSIEQGSSIAAGAINLNAKTSMTIGDNVSLIASKAAGQGEISLYTQGNLSINAGAVVKGENAVSLDAGSLSLLGKLDAANGSLLLASNRIQFAAADKVPVLPGFILTESLWKGFGTPSSITLRSRSDLAFLGSVSIDSAGLTLDAKSITGDGGIVTVAAKQLQLANSSANETAAPVAGTGSITLSADTITVRGGVNSKDTNYANNGKINFVGGDTRLSGFAAVNLNSKNDLVLQGKGSLNSGGNLSLTAARLTTTFSKDDAIPYSAADFKVNALGEVAILAGSGTAGTDSTPGGSLAVSGKSIRQTGVIEVAAGKVTLAATGTGETDGVALETGAKILAKGTVDAPGGMVAISAANGPVKINTGAVLDVSAGTQGDAGTIALLAGKGGVTIQGDLHGEAGAGNGGSLTIDSNRIDDMATLNTKIVAGGFNNSLNLRARAGNVTIAAGQEVTAREVRIAADSGSLNLAGSVTADGTAKGGTVELFAGTDLNLTGKVSAKGTGIAADGGDVLLSSRDGRLTLAADSSIDVSGTGNQGGTLHLRAKRDTVTNADLNMSLNGTVTGASEVVAEGVKVDSKTGNATLTSADYSAWQNSSADFIAKATTLKDAAGKTALDRLTAGLKGVEAGAFHLRPGVEVRSTGDLTINTALDLNTWRFNNEPGYLTLRAANNLNIYKNITNNPTGSDYLQSKSGNIASSWGYRLVAGADAAAADVMATVNGTGNLNIGKSGAGALVYTESGPILFAAGNDVTIAAGLTTAPQQMVNSYFKYNLATYAGTITGNAGNNLTISSGAAIQSAVGDISLRTGRNLANSGAIRTTGEFQGDMTMDFATRMGLFSRYWEYAGGGSIDLKIVGAAETSKSLITEKWDGVYTDSSSNIKYLAASYGGSGLTPLTGIAAMGGGDVTVLSGGNFFDQVGTFGKGDLKIFSNGDLRGRFLLKEGTSDLVAAGNIGKEPNNKLKLSDVAPELVLELRDGQFNLRSQGNIELGALVNPTITKSGMASWNLTYGLDSGADLVSRHGDVSLYGSGAYTSKVTGRPALEKILPGTLSVNAAGDIKIYSDLVLAPSPSGNLTMIAGGSIDGLPQDGPQTATAKLQVSDLNPADVYGYLSTATTTKVKELTSTILHAATPVHQNDATSILLRAGTEGVVGSGDISNLKLIFSKQAQVIAQRDLLNIFYEGQNNRETDLTTFSAGRKLVLTSRIAANADDDIKYGTGMQISGPGTFLVRAGESINLGTSKGIQSVGNSMNPALPDGGVSVIVAAGLDPSLPLANGTGDFFTQLLDAGRSYRNFIANGQTAEAETELERTRDTIIGPFIGQMDKDKSDITLNPKGSINMTFSEISSSSGSNLYLLAAGDLNVGKSAGSGAQGNTGIYTSAGGGINIYATGDVNVNESRVMTFRGGDIMVWSDQGDINAGRGSRTAISTSPPTLVAVKDSTGAIVSYTLYFSPPAIGSGARAVTYDPDGVQGPLLAPEAGDIDFFAPEGKIDAGEAGILGKNVNLVAPIKVNMQNVAASGTITGGTTGDASVSLGSLSGVSNVSDSSKMIEQSASLGQAKDSDGMAKKVDDFIAAWLDVKVINFDAAPAADNDEKKNRKSTGSTEG